MPYLLLILGVIFGVYGLYRFFLNATLKQIKTLIMAMGLAVICAALFFLALSGRFPAALALVTALWPFALAFRLKQRNKNKYDAKTPRSRSGQMTKAEALEVLGLKEGVTPEEIKKTYKKLIKKIHPDQEGSQWLASKINQAKDTLLG